jgi:ABC-type branched-subunit amino acid transport system substrate-binding protein
MLAAPVLGVLLVVLLAGCAQQPGQNVNWNPNSWFGGSSVNQNSRISQTSPDISHIKGPLTPPDAAPRVPVAASPLPMPNTTLSTSSAPAKVKVAILLPLTGKNAALGQAMLNAAQQAVFDTADNRFELMPRDTGASDDTATTAARDAVASGAQLIIGPLFAANIPAVRSITAPGDINMLTLSTDTSQAGPGVFVMGFTPGPQVDRVVAYAIAHGLHHFAALIPDNPYGALVGPAFEQAVARYGGTVTAMETYDPIKRDSDAHIKNLAAHHDQIDALFLPEGGGDITAISNQLAAAGFDNHTTRLLGTGLWDVPALAKQAPFIVSGWYAASDPAARQGFIKAYTSTYGQEPPRLATLGYDATALAAVLAKRGAHFNVIDLTNPNGFAGLDGIFRLTQQGLVERGLAVNEVDPQGAHVIDPAPRSFAAH